MRGTVGALTASLFKLDLRRFGTQKMSRKFTMQEVESKYVSQRFDKVVMSKLGMPWSDVHRYVR